MNQNPEVTLPATQYLGLVVLGSAFAGAAWALLRIETILIVPYAYRAIGLVDVLAYIVIGQFVGSWARRAPPARRWEMAVFIGAAYTADRLISFRLALGVPEPSRFVWPGLMVEGLMLLLGMVSGWWQARR